MSKKRVPYSFASWNGPMEQRGLWKLPEYYWWQRRILEYFAGGLHRRAVVSTPNEAGKTQILIPAFGLAVMAAFPGSTVYSTAGSENQVKDQLFRYLEGWCRPWRGMGWEVNRSSLVVTAPAVGGLPPSQWVGRVPRDALTAEGYHEGWTPDNERFLPLLMILDEAKSLGDDVFEMAMRLRATWVLAVSTPDVDTGPFYRAVGPEMMLARGEEEPGCRVLEDMRRYWGLRMMVFQEGCAHLMTEEKQVEAEAVREHSGENSKLYRSMVRGLFSAGESEEKLYQPRDMAAVMAAMGREATEGDKGGEAHAGLDLSFTGDGDAKVMYILKGRVVLPKFKTREDNTVHVAKWAVDILRAHGVEPRNCRVDNGGGGKVIVDMMESVYGYYGVDRYANNAAATYNAEYYDRATEDAYGVKNLLNFERIILPPDEDLLDDMKNRRVKDAEAGKVKKKKLQKKRDHRAMNSGKSPDDLDTLTMCLSGIVKPGLMAFEGLGPKAEGPETPYDEKRVYHIPFKTQKDAAAEMKKMAGWAKKAPSMAEIMRGARS